MDPVSLAVFAGVWLLFGGLATFGYWRNNHTENRTKRRLITVTLVLGGILSLILGDSIKLHHHHHHHAGAKT